MTAPMPVNRATPPPLAAARVPQPAAPEQQDQRPWWRRKRWLSIGVPVSTLAFLVAIAPPLPPGSQPAPISQNKAASDAVFR
ncbi:MAG: hypothetical protein ACO262_05670, partial [Vulcanococcus sp.]